MHKRKVEEEKQRAGGSKRNEEKNCREARGKEITPVSLILFMLHWGNSMFPYQSDCRQIQYGDSVTT